MLMYGWDIFHCQFKGNLEFITHWEKLVGDRLSFVGRFSISKSVSAKTLRIGMFCLFSINFLLALIGAM